jgi:hypothetical protein
VEAGLFFFSISFVLLGSDLFIGCFAFFSVATLAGDGTAEEEGEVDDSKWAAANARRAFSSSFNPDVVAPGVMDFSCTVMSGTTDPPTAHHLWATRWWVLN